MKKYFQLVNCYLCCVFLILQSCDTTDYQFIPKQFTVIHDSLGKQLVRQCSRPSPSDVTQFFTLSESEINTLHQNFKKINKLEPVEAAFKELRITTIENYAYQYVGIIRNDKKYIYINSFRKERALTTPHDWKRLPMIICDGGPHIWGVLFDLNEVCFSELHMNGSL